MNDPKTRLYGMSDPSNNDAPAINGMRGEAAGDVDGAGYQRTVMLDDQPPIEVFHQAIENIKPQIEVRSKRVGGAAYQVPMQVNRTRQQSLAIRWLLIAVREKKGRPTANKLADELLAAYNKEGAAMTRRDNVHRMADANKAFAHFAW